MRICFIDSIVRPDKPGRSGTSDTVWGMCQALVEQGHVVDIIATYGEGPVKDPRITVHKGRTSRVAYRNILGRTLFLLEASQALRKIEPDIVHSRDYLTTAVLLARGNPCPVVLTTPGNIYSRIKEGHSFDWSVVAMLKWAAKLTARKCHGVIATSTGMRQAWLRTGVANNRLVLIPLGIDVSRFYEVRNARSQVHLPEGSPILLYVGRYAREKGVCELLQAIKVLADTLRSNSARVILIGSGPERLYLDRMVSKHSLSDLVDVKDYVHQDQLKLWYSAADVLLMPSWNEPFGKVFLEAMSCGTPSIASLTEGPKDHILHGRNGLLVPPRDTKSLVYAIRQVIQHPELLTQMKVNCLRHVSDNLRWEVITRDIVSHVYQPLLNGQPVCQPQRYILPGTLSGPITDSYSLCDRSFSGADGPIHPSGNRVDDVC